MKETKQITLPEGTLCSYCCGDCLWMDKAERDSMGRCWCSEHRTYYDPGEYAGNCSKYRQR